MPSRDTVVKIAVAGSSLLATLSLVAAYLIRSCEPWCDATVLKYGLLAFWALAPPIYFFGEWTLFRPEHDKRDDVKHSHDLARNIWVAFVVVLAVALGVSWPG